MSVVIKTLEGLFVSKVRIKALRYFFINPKKSIHLRGAVRDFEEEINAVRRELSRLESVKLIISENKGNRKYYKLNLEHPFCDELISMFHKSSGIGLEIISNEKKLGDIEFALLTPAFTRGTYYGNQPIDLLVVGNVDLSLLSDFVKKEEYNLNREIHYMVMKSSDFQIRKRRRDQNLIDILLQDSVMLIGSHTEMVK